MQFLDMSRVDIAQCTPLVIPRGGTVLLECAAGPLIAIAPRGGFEDAVVGFAIVAMNENGAESFNTLWPRRTSFPVFMHNALAYLGGTNQRASVESLRTGQIVPIRVSQGADQIVVRGPDGSRRTMRRGEEPVFWFADTGNAGIYEVHDPERPSPRRRFAVNLFDARESDIRAADTLDTEYERIPHQPAVQTVQRQAWKPLLLGALLVLLLEWYVYHRRVSL
jgi:hypothetical protein